MNTNRCISKRTTVPVVGCAAHRLNLGVKALIKAKCYQDTLKRLSSLLRKLRTVSRWAKLGKAGCPCKPAVLHEIRWTGAFDLIDRYIKIRPYLELFESDVDVDRCISGAPQYEFQDKSVQELIPSATEHARLVELYEMLKAFTYAKYTLQSPKVTVADLRDLFDALMMEHGSLKAQLGPDAKVVESKMFENALVKLPNKIQLTRTEKSATERLLREPSSTCEQNSPAEPPKANKPTNATALKIQRDLKRNREIRGEDNQSNINTAWIPSTSVVVEQCFSQVNIITGYLRRSLHVETKCALLMLRLNWDLLTIHDVSRAIIEARPFSSPDDDADESDSGFDD